MTEERFRQIIREELRAELQIMLGMAAPARSAAKSPAEIALEMARSGDIEGSKAYLRSLSGAKRRKAA